MRRIVFLVLAGRDWRWRVAMRSGTGTSPGAATGPATEIHCAGRRSAPTLNASRGGGSTSTRRELPGPNHERWK